RPWNREIPHRAGKNPLEGKIEGLAMKDCKKIHPLLPLYREGGLTPKEKVQVEKHLESCQEARTELEQLELISKALLKLPEPSIPPDLHGKILTHLGRQGMSFPKPQIHWLKPLWAVAAAAIVMVIYFNPSMDWKSAWKSSTKNEVSV